MDLQTYPYNHLESVAVSLLEHIGVYSYPVDPEAIAEFLGIRWVYLEADSFSDLVGKKVLVDKRLDHPNQRTDFAHEIAHIILHCGSQLTLPELFVNLQEWQANLLALYILVPSHFLISALKHAKLQTENENIALIAQAFQVSIDFAKLRYRKFLSQIQSAELQNVFIHQLRSLPKFGRDYDNTLSIGNIEFYYLNGGVVYQRKIADV